MLDAIISHGHVFLIMLILFYLMLFFCCSLVSSHVHYFHLIIIVYLELAFVVNKQENRKYMFIVLFMFNSNVLMLPPQILALVF